MAKQIKALKCPQCGSVKKQSVKEDHYLCNNCGTEYFLDNDDINVNVNHSYRTSPHPGLDAQAKKYIILFIAGIVLLILSISIIGTCSGNKSAPSTKTFSVTEVSKPKYVDRIKDMVAFTAHSSKNPMLLFIITRSKDGYDRNNAEYIARFYDPINEKIISDMHLPTWKDDHYMRDRLFSDGVRYLCPDKSNRLYKIDVAQHKIVDVTEEFFGSAPEFASGIATLKFTQKVEGDGFNIMTNDGKEYYYYPLVRKIYKDNMSRREAATAGLSSLLPGAIESIYYTFSEKSNQYPEEKIQLVKYWYKHNAGYPIMLPYSHQVKSEKVYNYPKGSGVYVGNFPYKKKLMKEPRITRFIDMTPDRLYFDAKIAYQDSANLYISGLPNANPEGKRMLQKIDTESGRVLWTFNKETDFDLIDREFYGYANGLIFAYYDRSPNRSTSNMLVIIDHNGNVIKELPKDELFKNKS